MEELLGGKLHTLTEYTLVHRTVHILSVGHPGFSKSGQSLVKVAALIIVTLKLAVRMLCCPGFYQLDTQICKVPPTFHLTFLTMLQITLCAFFSLLHERESTLRNEAERLVPHGILHAL